MKSIFRVQTVLAVMVVLLCSPMNGQTIAPKPVNMRSPDYPATLAGSGKDGTATLEVEIKADGAVGESSVVSASDPAFGEAAAAVIREWKFEPATRDGQPVAIRVKIPFQFPAPAEDKVNALNTALGRKVFIELPEKALSEKEYGRKLKVKTPAQPIYPKQLFKSGVKEEVKVSFIVAPDGTVLNPRIEGEPRRELRFPAIMTMSKYVYVPPVKDGKGVYVETSTKLKFQEPPPRPPGGKAGGKKGGGGGPPPEPE